jgi:hypothetical protein
VLHIFDKEIVNEKKIKDIKRTSKYGSCGTNENGDLLHSMLNGPAL